MLKIIESLNYSKEDWSNLHSATRKGLVPFAIISWIILLAAQLFMILTFSGDQIADAKTYYEIAKNLLENGLWYPSTENIHSVFIFGNGYVNFIILSLKITGTIKSLFFSNIVFCQIILFSCLHILKKVTENKNIICWFVILFCFLNTFWSEVVALRTEFPFTAIVCLAFALLFEKKRAFVIVAGVLLALANWVRPLGPAMLVCALAILIYQGKKLKEHIKLIISFVLTVVIIGSATYAYCGHFIYQSTTLGFNLIMSANDKADGSYMDTSDIIIIPEEKKEEMIYEDYDKFYMEKSLEWISENPIKYISQIPKKLFFLFSTETYSGSAYYNNEIPTAGIEYIKNLYLKLTRNSNDSINLADILIIFNQLWYIFICLLALCGAILAIKKNKWRFFLPFFLFIAAGTAITIVVVGGARYHFPYLPFLMMFSAFSIEIFSCFCDRKRLVKNSYKRQETFE